MNINYTICFIRKNNQFLMLYRKKNPNLHKWNGVGGKIEPGETPVTSVIREVREETGLIVEDPIYKGIVSWNDSGGMHVFVISQFDGEIVSSDEGPLEWKDIQWILESKDVVSNIPLFFDHLLSDEEPVEYAFHYSEEGNIVSYHVLPIQKN